MRVITEREEQLVGGGTDSYFVGPPEPPPETMDMQCFVATVVFGISPIFGMGGIASASLNFFNSCYDDFSDS